MGSTEETVLLQIILITYGHHFTMARMELLLILRMFSKCNFCSLYSCFFYTQKEEIVSSSVLGNFAIHSNYKNINSFFRLLIKNKNDNIC